MKVKELRQLLYKLEDDEEIVLLNNQAPLNAALPVEEAVIVQTPTEKTDIETGETDTVFKNKLILTYSTRERSEKQ